MTDQLAVTPARWHSVRWPSLRLTAGRLAGALRHPAAAPGPAPAPALTARQRHLLTALEAAVDGMRDRRGRAAAVSYDVAAVLAPLAVLGRTETDPVRADLPSGLRARGRPETLAQVFLTLLGNAARHAPGAPVLVTAEQVGDMVRLTVTNDTLPAAAAEPGLGLRVCARLIVAEQGRMRVRPAPGWAVVLEVPAA